MSLLRLLTAGRSLVNVRDTGSRYRLTTQRLLPQFAPARNPFAGKPAEAEPPPAPAVSPETGAARVSSASGARGADSVREQKAARWWNGSKRIVSGLMARRVSLRSRPVAAGAARAGRAFMDRVKVVRNDLSETDVEVTTVKQGAARAVDVGGGGGEELERGGRFSRGQTVSGEPDEKPEYTHNR